MENIQDLNEHEIRGRGRRGRPGRTGHEHGRRDGAPEADDRRRRRGHGGDLGPRGEHGPRGEFRGGRRAGRGPENEQVCRGRGGRGRRGDLRTARELPDLMHQLTRAVRQAASVGTTEQAQATADVLTEARRAIYRILADDTTAAMATTTA